MDSEFNRQGVARPGAQAQHQGMTTSAPVRETENPYLNGNYAPVQEESTATDLDITERFRTISTAATCVSAPTRWRTRIQPGITGSSARAWPMAYGLGEIS